VSKAACFTVDVTGLVGSEPRGQLALWEAGAERICLWVDYANPFGAKKLYYSEGYVNRYIISSYVKDK
jgi:hypothetical protein